MSAPEDTPKCCVICKSQVTKTHTDDVGTQFFNCPKCGSITKTLSESSGLSGSNKDTRAPKILEHINNIENPLLVNTPVIVEAVVSSTSVSYQIPKKYKSIITFEENDKHTIVSEISLDHPIILELVGVSKEQQSNRLTKTTKLNYGNVERVTLKEILDYRTVYLLRVRPPVFTLEKQGDRVVDEKGYEYKHLDLFVVSNEPLNFQPSTLMRLTGKPLPHPKNQRTTMLSYRIEFPEDSFNYDIEKLKQLKTYFEQKELDQKSVKERFNWILENFEKYSHIFGRQNIATAALLCYFSPLYVQVNGNMQRGWAIIVIIGDTTTGKSETVKKMSKLLKAGSLISAETASTVGLTGTAVQLEQGWFIEWGFLPLMDRKLLGIDGCHKLGASSWAALAETERNGVLSIAKAAKNTAYARARQIRIYNAVDKEADRYSTKSLKNFLYPVQSLNTVLDKTSIARIDLAVFSDQRDVTPEAINKKITEEPHCLLENLSEVLKWAWSNKAKVEWTDQAVNTLLSEATEFYNRFFFEAIPLVSFDVKDKIARLSIALAYCTLSTNSDFSTVTVNEDHVKTIVEFLNDEYIKNGLGILAQEQNFEKLTKETVDLIFKEIDSKLSKNSISTDLLVDILQYITKNHTTLDELKTKFSLSDNNQARPLIAELKSQGLISSKNGYYATSKLIEAYKVTNGFSFANVIVKKKPTGQQKIGGGGSYSNPDNPDNSDKKEGA